MSWKMQLTDVLSYKPPLFTQYIIQYEMIQYADSIY